MKIVVEGKEYLIWFEHHIGMSFSGGGLPVRGYTIANIRHATPGDELTREEMVDAALNTVPAINGERVWRSRADCSIHEPAYSRSRGRKLALLRALRQVWPDREKHSQVWKQLFVQGMKK